MRNIHCAALSALLLACVVTANAAGTIAESPVAPTAVLGKAYDVTFQPNTQIDQQGVQLASLIVPAGSYMAYARMQVQTGSIAPGNNFRLDCTLDPGIDDGTYRVGYDVSVERYVTFQGAVRLNTLNQIKLVCSEGNGHVVTLLSGKLTVITVGAAGDAAGQP